MGKDNNRMVQDYSSSTHDHSSVVTSNLDLSKPYGEVPYKDDVISSFESKYSPYRRTVQPQVVPL